MAVFPTGQMPSSKSLSGVSSPSLLSSSASRPRKSPAALADVTPTAANQPAETRSSSRSQADRQADK